MSGDEKNSVNMAPEPIAISRRAEQLVEALRDASGPLTESHLLAQLGTDARACSEDVEELERLGYRIVRGGDRTYEVRQVPDRLLRGEIRRHLQTRWLGHDLYCFDVVGSTNSVARELAGAGVAHGAVVTAEAQQQGRGRLGRSWVSPAYQNLYASVVLRITPPSGRLSQISLLAGVAACDAVREWHPATIKWPNDVLIQGRKVAGILAELEGCGRDRCVVLGVGVNLNTRPDEFPPELRDKAGSLRHATGVPIDRARMVGRLLTHLERRCEQLEREGFAAIAEAWRTRSDVVGKSIQVDEVGRAVAGEVIGLDDDGALVLRLSTGAEHRVVAGDVTVIDGYENGETERADMKARSQEPRAQD